MIRCAVVGAAGYTGVELTKILLRHPYAEITALTTRSREPAAREESLPDFPHESGLHLERFDFEKIARLADVVFLALPHTEAMEIAARFFKRGEIVIDLSADFRLHDPRVYAAWYQHRHKSKDLLRKAVYGLPEIHREKIKNANLIANPGCYATGAILALKPLLESGLIEREGVVIDAKSGTSGAGRKVTPTTFFGEVYENFKAYKVNHHHHMPEIAQALNEITGERVSFCFVPHLLPIERGILSTVYATKRGAAKGKDIRGAFERGYADEPFVKLKPEGDFPSLKEVRETNFCWIGIYTDPHSDRVIIVSAIDNLMKGASGQAVQNFNIRSGFPEEMGLVLKK